MSSKRSSIGVSVFLALSALVPTWAEPDTPLPGGSTTDEIIARVARSVVSIEVEVAGDTRRGSGFVVRDDGIIATNLQLVLNARAVRVRFQGGEDIDAVGWVAFSVINNLALIQCPLPKESVAPLALNESVPVKDARVFAISRPFGPEPSVVDGIVTGLSEATADNGNQTPLVAVRILTNIPISPASSGGPLVDHHGAVVGVVQESDKYDQNPNVAIFVEPLREPLGRSPLKPTPWLLPQVTVPDGPLGSAVAYSDRARARWSQGEVDASIADYTEAIRLDPQDAENYHERGVAWMNKRDYDRAIADFTEAIRLAPQNPQTLFLRGTAWINKDEFRKAISDLSKAIAIDPTHPPAYQLRGYARLRTGKLDRAIADLDETIRLDPEFHLAYFHRGLAWKEKGDKERAKSDFEVFNRRPGSNPLANKEHLAVVIKSDQAPAESRVAEEIEALTPTRDALDRSKWIAKGRWIAEQAEQQVVLHFYRNPDRDAQVCQLTFAGPGLGTKVFTFDILLDADKKRIAFLPYRALMNENGPAPFANATLMTNNTLRIQGRFEGYKLTLEIDEDFARMPQTASGD